MSNFLIIVRVLNFLIQLFSNFFSLSAVRMRNFGIAYELFPCFWDTANGCTSASGANNLRFLCYPYRCLCPLFTFAFFQRERERTDWARCPAACESANRKPLPFIASPGTLHRVLRERERQCWEEERKCGREITIFLQGPPPSKPFFLPHPLSLHCCLIIKREASFVYRRWFVWFRVCSAPGSCDAGRQVESLHAVEAHSSHF